MSTSLKQAFPVYIPVLRPLIVPQKLLIHPSWIAVEKNIFFSLASGDDSFMVKVTNSKDLKGGGRVELTFVLTQHSRDLSLIMILADHLECGHCYTYKDYAEFKCRNGKDIHEKILLLFLKYPLLLVLNGSQDFEDGAKVAEIMKLFESSSY